VLIVNRWTVVCLLILLLTGCRRSLTTDQRAELVKQGDAFMEQHDYNKAIAAYAAAVKGDRDGEIMFKLSQAYSRADNFQQFYRTAIRAADALPDNITAQVEAARALLRTAQFDDAATRADRALAKDPDNVDALIQRGNAAAHLVTSAYAMTRLAGASATNSAIDRTDETDEGDEKAEELFRRAVTLQTDRRESSARLALVNFLWAVGRLDESEPILKQLAEDHPDDWQSNQALGDLYMARQRDADAERYLKRAAALDGGNSAKRRLYNLYMRGNRPEDAAKVLATMPPSEDANGAISLRLATIEFEAGRPADALRRVDPLVGRTPPVAGAGLLKARILVAQGDWNGALPLARDAVATDAASSLAASTLGRALAAMGDLEGAQEAQTTAHRLDPKAAGPLLELARLSLALGKTEKAAAQARDAVRLAPADRQAHLMLAKALMAKRDYAAADDTLKPLLAHDPTPEVLVEAGALHAARGNLDAARAAYTLALQASADSVDAICAMASLDLTQQRTAAARQRIEEALVAHPRDPRYLELAARIYATERDTLRTEVTLRKLIDAQPGNLGAALTLARSLSREHPQDARKVLEQLLERRPQASIEVHRALESLAER
jgi:cellulose synthase operon protein C